MAAALLPALSISSPIASGALFVGWPTHCPTEPLPMPTGASNLGDVPPGILGTL